MIEGDIKILLTSGKTYDRIQLTEGLREIAENVKNYANKKHIDIDFIMRW